MGKRLTLSIVICLLVGAAAGAGPDEPRPPSDPGSITMRPSAVIGSEQDIRLRDLAVLRGGAVALGEQVIEAAPELGHPSPQRRIGPREVIAALGQIDGIDWSLLMVRGAACEVRFERAADTPAARDRTPALPGRPGRFEGFVLASSTAPGTARGHAALALAGLFDVQPGDLRLSFERSGAPLLDADTHGLTIQTHPLGAGDRVPVRIRVFDPLGEQMLRNGVVHARVEIRTRCARVRSTLRRGTIVHEDQVTLGYEWVRPSLRASPVEDVIGSALRRTLERGRVVTETDVEPPLLVKRGDKVGVHCVSGSIVLRTTARAVESGRRGDVIELESLEADRRKRRRFSARISGPGEVVASADTDLTGARGAPGG